MTYEELLANIASKNYRESRTLETPYAALRAVVELHSPTNDGMCKKCLALSADYVPYPCFTIQAIEKELV